MKNKLLMLIFGIVCFMLINTNCYAASASIKSSTNSITKGNNVTITLTVSSDSPLVSIEGTLKCSGAGVNTGEDLRFDDSSNSLYSKTYTLTVKPTSAGTLSCFTEGVRLTEMAKDNWQNIGNKQVNVTVNNPVVIPPKQYSSNNNLSSLGVEGFEFDKSFNKETVEYNLELPNGTEKINITAKTEDSKAKVTGIGEISVVEGANKIEVKVTAENGNIKTYTINAIVKELDPINVKVDDKDYSIVRKEGILEPLEGFEKSTVKINEEDVLSYYNDVTKYNLVILKDNEGNSNYYLYKDGKYTLYKEYNFSGVRLHLLDSKAPENYVERELTINDEKIKAYQLNTSKDNTTYALDKDVLSNYYLIYAMNVNTGNENYYLIDKLENTAIRYDKELNNLFLDINNDSNYKDYFFIAVGCFGIVLVVFGIITIVNGRKKKNKLNFK